MFGAPFGFSRVSLGKLASFPESESWSGAKSEAKLRKSANYPGIFQVCTMKKLVYPQNTGILPILLISAPKQPQTRLRAQNLTISTQFSRENREENRGCCREKRKGKPTGCERKTSDSPQTALKRQSSVCPPAPPLAPPPPVCTRTCLILLHAQSTPTLLRAPCPQPT